MPNHTRMTTLPLEPLMRVAGATCDNKLARQLGIRRTSIVQFRRRGGITIYHADKLACRLGLNSSSIWGDAFYGPILSAVAR